MTIIAQISDTHITPHTPDADQRTYDLALAITDINNLNPIPDVIIHTGDIVQSGRQDEYDLAISTLAKARVPVYVVAGNKDNRVNLRKAFAPVGCRARDCNFIDYAIEDHPIRLIALDTLSPDTTRVIFVPSGSSVWST